MDEKELMPELVRLAPDHVVVPMSLFTAMNTVWGLYRAGLLVRYESVAPPEPDEYEEGDTVPLDQVSVYVADNYGTAP